MMKITSVLVTAALWSATAWTAEEPVSSRHESIGIGSGALIGGAAGGPVGLVLGAAMGAWLGDRFDVERNARVQFEQRWNEARAEVEALNGLVTTSERQVAALESRLREETRQMHTTVRDALDVQVLFRTDEATLEEETEARLLRLAELFARLDGTLIRIDGHADSRGNPEHNAQLSAQRAASVRDTLIRAGVPTSRILMDAHGETYSSAAEGDVDAMALERRVDLTLIRTGDESRMAQK